MKTKQEFFTKSMRIIAAPLISLAIIFLFRLKTTALSSFFILSGIGLVFIAYALLFSNNRFYKSIALLTKPIKYGANNYVLKQLGLIALLFMPIIVGLTWGVGGYALVMNYGLKRYGVEAYAVIQKQSFYETRDEYFVDLQIKYDGHQGVLRAYSSKSYGAYPAYNEFLYAAQNNKRVQVHYFKAFPSIVRSNSQIDLSSQLEDQPKSKSNDLQVITTPSNQLDNSQ